ncbi:MAG TPA: hypothetical protein VND94_20705 [Terriglobia bacterium]|nr:hypothetical protein [Terriglobia bacterium]
MAINAYSSYAAYLANIGGIQNIQTSLTTLTQQLNTGKKSSDLTFYGSDTTRLTSLRAEVSKRQGYVNTINTAATDVKAYDNVFTTLEQVTSQMQQAFTAPDTDPPTAQINKITFSGDIGDIGDTYKVTVDGVVFSYVTNGNEGSFDEIAGNLANQINSYTPPLQASAKANGATITITGKTAGPNYNVSASVIDVPNGNQNGITASLTQQGNISPIVAQVNNALIQIQALLNEQVGDHYLFGGLNGNDLLPVVDLTRLPDPSGSKNAAIDATTQQIAPGTVVQTSRITTDYLGNGQNTTITVNGNPFTFTGPLTQQQLAAQMSAAITGLPVPGVTVQDVDATGFTIKSTTPGTPVTISIASNDPTPSTVKTVQPNIPLGASQVDNIALSGPVGVIGETYSVTITDPPAHTLPVTISYRTDGTEKDLNAIAGKLVGLVNNYQPPFSVTATNTGNGTLQLSSTSSFISNAAVGEGANVSTTQRTVAPVAQEDQVTFPGPFGDIGDVYTINFTAPVAGPFTVTTTASDNEATVAQQMASQINAAGIGVTAVVKSGHLSVTSNTPGTPFTMAAALTVDAPPTSTAAPVQTNVVANIAGGPLPQMDTISLSGPAGRKGDIYEVSVNGRTIDYTTDGTERDMDAIAIKLTALINAATPPFPASAVPGVTGSGQLILTGTPGVPLDSKITITKPTTVPNPTPTDYNIHQKSSDSALAWSRSDITIADQTTLKYTFSANDPALQKLVLSLRYAQSAVQDPANYQAKMDTAKQLARDALVGIRTMHTDNTINDTVMSAATLSHQTSVNLLTNSTDKIEGVDPNEVAAKIQQAQVQLQSAFGAFATTSKISLINFLA